MKNGNNMKQIKTYISEGLRINKNTKIWNIKDAKEGDYIQFSDKDLYFIFKMFNKDHEYSDTLSEDTIIYYAAYNSRINKVHIGPSTGIGDSTKEYNLAPKEIKDAFNKALKKQGYEWDEYKKELYKVVKL